MTKEQYFNTIVEKVLKETECILNIDIKIMDHDTIKGKHKNAVGLCWQNEDGFMITIDEFFVSECYSYFILDSITSTWELNGETLEKVLCHEIAHVQEWRHGKRHTELTNELFNMVTMPEKYYRYINKKIKG